MVLSVGRGHHFSHALYDFDSKVCLLKTFALQCDSEPRRIRWDVIDLVTVMAGAVWYERDREYRETFDTRELAQDKLDNVKKQLAQGQSPASLRERGRETFGAVAAQRLASRHDLKPRTHAEYANLLGTKTRARRDRDGATTADLSITATFGISPSTRSPVRTSPFR